MKGFSTKSNSGVCVVTYKLPIGDILSNAHLPLMIAKLRKEHTFSVEFTSNRSDVMFGIGIWIRYVKAVIIKGFCISFTSVCT